MKASMYEMPAKAAIQTSIEDEAQNDVYVFDGATGEELSMISSLMANGLPRNERKNPNLVWMANMSLGGREADGPVAAEIRYPKDMYHEDDYDGYDPDQSERFYWESASSGASIEAVKGNGEDNWQVEFRDPRNESVMYARIFDALCVGALASHIDRRR